ncbi:hypothetical protein GIB67_036020 [Kingdonia uniflora]|uniref:Galactokinase N-terminal domain-containing protein n=1 Tax=Kingdonia uniflora TaxID=39325 RepID=A0A7J7N0U7_9MAGN|nr:hypothetical protein GIB67_036020 [Kingdonia uniflora]
MEYIPNSRRGSYKQGKPLFMDADADDEQPMDKNGKNITLENLKFEQVREWVLSCFDGVEEWEEKHKKYLDEQLIASRGRGARSKVKPMGFIPWLRQQLENDKMSILKRLADGPSFKAVSYKGYRVNGNSNQQDEPFCLTSQASQVLYCKDPSKDDCYVVIDAPQRLNKDIDAYEGPLVFEARTPASTATSMLLNDLVDEDEEIDEGTWVMLISSGRRSMSSDQMEDFYNLVPQRASTLPGLLRKRKAITLNEVGQAVGDKSTKFSTRIGEIAREHIPTWKGVSNGTKMLIWNSLSNEYKLLLATKDQVLIGANIAWKNKKCELRKIYDKYPTDDVRKKNCPTRIIQEDWERFVDLSSDPKVVAMRARNKRSEDPETARTNYFLAGHTYSDGSFLTPFLKAKVAKIKSNVEKNPEPKHYDVDDDPVGQAYGPEKKGRVLGEGILVTKSMLKHMKLARTIIKEGKLAYNEINNKLNVVIDEVKTLKENATRKGQRTQNASPYYTSETSSHVCRHEREVGIHFFNFHRDEVVAVGRAIFPRNQTNNPNEYDVLVDLIIDEDAEVSGRRGMLFRDIPVGEWFKYPSFLLKIIDEFAQKMNSLRDEVAAKCAQDNNETEQTKVCLMRANVEKQDPSANNKVFLSGWDKTRRPISVVLGGRHVPTKGTEGIEDLRRLMVYSLDKICASNLPTPSLVSSSSYMMAKCEDLPLPVFTSLEPFYGNGSQHEEADQLRFDNIKSKFLEVFGHQLELYVRSPGRVNLIGEHIDYEGYSVLPMAIRQDTIVAIRKHDVAESLKLLRIANVNGQKYSMCTYPTDPHQDIDLKNHKWGHYSFCWEKLNQVLMEKKESKSGMEILNLFQKEGRPRGTWNGKKADSDFYKMIVNAYEVKKQELMAENEQLRALLHSMQVTDMVAIKNVLGSWGVRLKLYNLLLIAVQCDRPIVFIQAELEPARIRIHELETERRVSNKKVEHFLTKVSEEKAAWRRREHEKIQAIIDDFKDDLNQSRKIVEGWKLSTPNWSMNLSMPSHLQSVLCKIMREREARKLREKVVDKLAQELGEERAENETMKRESVENRELEGEKKMLQTAEF